jgi:flagellar biosynthesis component FlhA
MTSVTAATWILAAISGVVALVLFGGLFLFLLWRKRHRDSSQREVSEQEVDMSVTTDLDMTGQVEPLSYDQPLEMTSGTESDDIFRTEGE